MKVNEKERFNISHPNLCPSLRWKGMYVLSERDASVPRSNDGLYWCVRTQTCIGPDGKLAEPGNCASRDRSCHAQCERNQNKPQPQAS